MSGDLQATLDFTVEFSNFHNVDLFQRGFYHIRCTLKPPAKIATSVDVEYKRSVEERRGENCLFPAFVEPAGNTCTAVTRTFQILYKNEDVTLNDAFVFTLHMLVDSTKVVKQIENAEMQLLVDLCFCDSEFGVSSPEHLSNVCTQTMTLHMSCVRGIHHTMPLLFDYYHFAAVDTTVHGILTAVGLPDLSILRPLKTNWLAKSQSNMRISTSTFYISLYGNRAESNTKPKTPHLPNKQTRYPSEIHRIVCTTLLSVQVNLLAYFQSLLEYLPENQRIPVGCINLEERLSFLSRGLDSLTDKDEVFSKICSDFSILSSEISLFWSQFQEFFVLNKHIKPYLQAEHHRQRVGHLSEAFFLQEYPLDQLSTIHQPNNFQVHQNLAQGVRNSRYYQNIPPLTVECPLLDGDQSSIPIIFEERFTHWPSTTSKTIMNSGTSADEAFSFGLDAEVEGDSESGSSEDQQVLLNDILACRDVETTIGLHTHGNSIINSSSECGRSARSANRTTSKECHENISEKSEKNSRGMKNETTKKESASLDDVGVDILPEFGNVGSSIKSLRDSINTQSNCLMVKDNKLYEPLVNERTFDSILNVTGDKGMGSLAKENSTVEDAEDSFPTNQENLPQSKYEEITQTAVRETDICDDILKEKDETSSCKSHNYQDGDSKRLSGITSSSPSQEEIEIVQLELGEKENVSNLNSQEKKTDFPEHEIWDNVDEGDLDGDVKGNAKDDDSPTSNVDVDGVKDNVEDENVVIGGVDVDFVNVEIDAGVNEVNVADYDVVKDDIDFKVARSDADEVDRKGDVSANSIKDNVNSEIVEGVADENDVKGDVCERRNSNTRVVDVKQHSNAAYFNNNSSAAHEISSAEDKEDSINQEVSNAVTAIAEAVVAAAEAVAEKAAEAVAAAAEAVAAAPGAETVERSTGSVSDTALVQGKTYALTDNSLSTGTSAEGDVAETVVEDMTVQNLPFAEKEDNDEICEGKRVYDIDITKQNEGSSTSLVMGDTTHESTTQESSKSKINQNLRFAEKDDNDERSEAKGLYNTDITKQNEGSPTSLVTGDTTQESSSSVYDTPLSSETSLSTNGSWTGINVHPGETFSADSSSSCPVAGSLKEKAFKKVKKSTSGKSLSSLGSCFPMSCATGNLSPTISLARGNSAYGGAVKSRFELAKASVKRTLAYPTQIYSELPSPDELVPYFSAQKPDSMETHLIVCVHGLDGNSGDLRLLRCYLEMALPSTRLDFLMSEVNQPDTFVRFEEMTEKLVSEIKHHIEAYTLFPTKISFIGHSLGNIIIRSALTHRKMEPYLDKLHTLLSLSGPHLGMLYHTSSLVSTGLWFMQKWKKSDSLLQLSLHDMPDPRQTFIYRLSQSKGLEYFNNVLLVSSVQDHYVPFHSARIEECKASMRDNSEYGVVYREMIDNLLRPLANKPSMNVVRYSVFHAMPSSANSFIGRAAHIAMLDSDLFIEKLLLVSALGFFR